MRRLHTLRLTLKRGALVAAANWPLVVMQFVADAVFKAMVALPIVGGVLLVGLLIGAQPADLLREDARQIVPTLAAVLFAQPVALAAFLGALALVLTGASVLMFAVKSGTIAILAEGESSAGRLEHPPLRWTTVRTAERFALDRYTAGVRRYFPRFLRLGLWLFVAYAVASGVYLFVVFGPVWAGSDRWPYVAAAASTSLVIVITMVNLCYLLVQVAIVSDDTGVARAAARVLALVRRIPLDVAGVFAAVLVLLVLATAASILATAALGLIAFVPLVGLVAVPLQLGACCCADSCSSSWA
jgi:hypothetical protein